MKPGLLTRNELIILNKRGYEYQLAIAEKDYFLAMVSKIIFDSPLRDKLVFKGGTAIHHCYLPQYRFSEDLDFTALDSTISSDEVRAVLEAHDFLSIKKEYVSKATIKFERVLYSGPLGLPNSLKLEIDFMQNVILPTRCLEYKNAYGVITDVMVMDIREICAEKIRACSTRARYRDFYDLFFITRQFNVDVDEIISLVRRKEVRKPISPAKMVRNLDDALQEKIGESGRIFYSSDVEDDALRTMVRSFDFEDIITQE